MSSDRPAVFFILAYLTIIVAEVPLFMGGALFWVAAMMALAGLPPNRALAGGLTGGALMWLSIGNLLAGGLAWQRSALIEVPRSNEFTRAVVRVSRRLRLDTRAKTQDELILRPRGTFWRIRYQETCIKLMGNMARITGPAIFFGDVKTALEQELSRG